MKNPTYKIISPYRSIWHTRVVVITAKTKTVFRLNLLDMSVNEILAFAVAACGSTASRFEILSIVGFR